MGTTRWVGVAAACALALVACKKVRDYGNEAREERRAEVAAAAAAAAKEVAPAEIDQPKPDEPVTLERSVAYAAFRGDVLDECTDIAVSAPAELGEAKIDQALADIKQRISPKAAVDVQTHCADQFKDRLALASCRNEEVFGVDAGVVAILIVSHYYNVKTTTDSDVHMRACMADGGKWTAATKDDRGAARERLRQRARELQKLAE